jgi:signal recognition particle GTPase
LKSEQQIDKKKAEDMASKMLAGDGFSLRLSRSVTAVRKMGSIQSLMGMCPRSGRSAELQKAAD